MHRALVLWDYLVFIRRAFGCKGGHEWVIKHMNGLSQKKRRCLEDVEPFHPTKSVESNGHPLHA